METRGGRKARHSPHPHGPAAALAYLLACLLPPPPPPPPLSSRDKPLPRPVVCSKTCRLRKRQRLAAWPPGRRGRPPRPPDPLPEPPPERLSPAGGESRFPPRALTELGGARAEGDARHRRPVASEGTDQDRVLLRESGAPSEPWYRPAPFAAPRPAPLPARRPWAERAAAAARVTPQTPRAPGRPVEPRAPPRRPPRVLRSAHWRPHGRSGAGLCPAGTRSLSRHRYSIFSLFFFFSPTKACCFSSL